MIGAIVLAAALAPAQPPKPALPAGWHGRWVGLLHLTPVEGEPRAIRMGLEVAPLADAGRHTWRIVYEDGPKRQVRDYELVAKGGRFEIDEKNGIRLGVTLAGDTLFSLFQVGDALIQTRYELAGDVVRVEVTAYQVKDALATRPTAGGGEVRSPKLLSVQRAELKRAGP